MCTTPPTQDAVKALKADKDKGLSSQDAEVRLAKYGPNELEAAAKKSIWALVLEQFEDLLVRILLLAALVSFLLAFVDEEAAEEGIGAFVEPFVIILILAINAFVGVWMEGRAESALEELNKMQAPTAKVLRDGTKSEIAARLLVPGDIVYVDVGDKVPADCRVLTNSVNVLANQSALTGESQPVHKAFDATAKGGKPIAENAVIVDKCNMIFSSTTLEQGHVMAVVVNTGAHTEMGKIDDAMKGADENKTPLEQALEDFGNVLGKIIAVICLIVWLMNADKFVETKWDGWTPLISEWQFSFVDCAYYFKIAVALAVAAIPEGLPAVITTCLALGTRRMSAKNAIVRSLPSVETLGCTTVICSDKTGTLTTNQMTCVKVGVFNSDGTFAQCDVKGSSYDPADGEVQGLKPGKNVDALCKVAVACNTSSLRIEEDAFKCTGLPTEGCLLTLVEKIKGSKKVKGSPTPACDTITKSIKTSATLDFDRVRKSMSVVVGGDALGVSGSNVLLAKGAPDRILERSTHVMLPSGAIEPLTDAMKQAVQQALRGMAEKSMRTLALAVKTEGLGALATFDGRNTHEGYALVSNTEGYEKVESGMALVGMVGILDPPRKEVTEALKDCHSAGIKVIMITGDNKLTAEAIAKDIGILKPSQEVADNSVEGRTFAGWDDEQQIEFLMRPGGKVFSRTEPTHKQDIVSILQRMNEVVAMTGDGVNDAPALKQADIGVAMGISGTAVAQQAADMVLADDNFSTIVAAVSEGRGIYNNMKAFIRYMISSNIGEVASIFLTAILGLPEGMIPVQLLWVNLVTDGPPATALSFNPEDPDIMEKPPRSKKEGLVSLWVTIRWLAVGLYVGAATVGIFVVWYTSSSFLGIDISHDGHVPVSLDQLRNFDECEAGLNDPSSLFYQFSPAPYVAGEGNNSIHAFFDEPCEYFDNGKAKASTLSLSVLVTIEMLNALNALSETHSLLFIPPWVNPWLCGAVVLSILSHCIILYVPFFNKIFSTVPLDLNEWLLVLAFSAPVLLLEEGLKVLVRLFDHTDMKAVEERRRASVDALRGAHEHKKDQ